MSVTLIHRHESLSELGTSDTAITLRTISEESLTLHLLTRSRHGIAIGASSSGCTGYRSQALPRSSYLSIIRPRAASQAKGVLLVVARAVAPSAVSSEGSCSVLLVCEGNRNRTLASHSHLPKLPMDVPMAQKENRAVLAFVCKHANSTCGVSPMGSSFASSLLTKAWLLLAAGLAQVHWDWAGAMTCISSHLDLSVTSPSPHLHPSLQCLETCTPTPYTSPVTVEQTVIQRKSLPCQSRRSHFADMNCLLAISKSG
jgi:hypothetical protein